MRAGGGGSYPPGWKGWQRLRRFRVSHEPRAAPWHSMHAVAYREHEGSNRHALPSHGEIAAR